jgi:transmembrane sensor
MGQKYFIWMAFAFSAIACGQRQGSVLGEGTSYTNGTGSSATFRLPDGSKAVLMPGTRIVVGKSFGKGGRNVEIDGEVWLDVTVGPPFGVVTRDLIVDVAGASQFRVDAWRARPGEEVDLQTGRLRVRKSYHSDTDSEPEMLEAGDMIMINRDIDLMEKEKMTPEERDKLKALSK